jgi:LacI family transcriptional regulator
VGVTLRDVAKSLGVSTSTISRTINGQGRISPATRKLIQERMQEMNYTPNVNAQRLVSGRAYMVALDFGSNSHLLDDTYFAELTNGIQTALQEFGYNLLLNATGDRLLHLVRSHAVDGVMMFAGEPEDADKLKQLAAEGTPSVLIGHCYVPTAPDFVAVFTDLSHGARQVADFLFETGHHRIGFIGSYQTDDVLDSFRDRLQELGAPLAAEFIHFAGPDPEQAERHMNTLLANPFPPTAVFARTDALAAGALRAAYRAGICVPGDVSIVGHDDVSLARRITPALTTVRIDCSEMGKMAAEAMRMMLDCPGVAMRPRVIRPELVVRETVTAPSK